MKTDRSEFEASLDDTELANAKARIERLLFENVIPAWYPESIDRIWGGYALDEAKSGLWARRPNKLIVTQARMTWFFSRLASFVPDRSCFLDAAEGGVRFLNRRMKDQHRGGYNTEVSPSGLRTTDSHKHLYGQTITLMALSEYARASSSDSALRSAIEAFQTIEERTHDTEFPGYRESFLPDWQPLPEGEISLRSTSDAKSLGMHIHVIEAYTVYLSVHQEELASRRIAEVLDIIRLVARRVESGGVCDSYQLDWTPHVDESRRHEHIRYGRNLKLISYFVDACDIIKQPVQNDIPWLETLLD